MGKKFSENLKKAGAVISPLETNEKWVDENGNIHYIDYAPINWERVNKERDYENIHKLEWGKR